MDHADKVPEIAIMFNHCVVGLAYLQSFGFGSAERDGRQVTLMRYPLARFNSLGPRTQRHEVALDDMLGVFGVQP